MCRQMTDRYRRATELASDLESFLRLTLGDTDSALTRDRSIVLDSPNAIVVPRGLRSFERDDADFFLRLLPGPRDRDGLPTSIRFWKTRIDERDNDETFKIGLLYGPSGCGKSSLVKAGLIPRLHSDLFALNVDSTPSDTEVRIKRGLAKRYSGLPNDGKLDEWLRILREHPELRSHQKIVIIIDQFEQWLATWSSNSDAELLRALRQCDGGNIQCLLLVRDDFWLPVSRLLSLAEVNVVDGFNGMLVDSFDLEHATRVLRELGVAYGRLPAIHSQQTAAQTAFIERAVAEMSEDNRLYPVRLAVFVEMVKNQPWAPETLASMGGAAGVGVAFLENSVGSKASPSRRLHESQTRNILSALLPETGQIKDCVRTREELLVASKYESKIREFDEVMHLLDVELRLVTPVKSIDSESSSKSGDASSTSGYVYQLTHDFLVPSIREWLDREYQSTSRGRAYLLLQQQSATWNQLRSPRYLPSILEWVVLRLKTNRRDWTKAQRRMMHAAARRVARSVALAGLVVCLLLALIWIGYRKWKFETDGILAKKFKETVLSMRYEDLKSVQSELPRFRKLLTDELTEVLKGDPDTKRRIRAAIALMPDGSGSIDWLVEQMVNDQTSPSDFLLIRDGLRPHSKDVATKLSGILAGSNISINMRFRAACAMATYSPDSIQLSVLTPEIVQSLVREPLEYAALWISALEPLAGELRTPLIEVLNSTNKLEPARTGALALSLLYADGLTSLSDVLTDSDGPRFRAIIEVLKRDGQAALDMLREKLDAIQLAAATEKQTDAWVQKEANIILAIFELRDPSALSEIPRLNRDPRLRTKLIHGLSPERVDVSVLLQHLVSEDQDSSLQSILRLALWRHLDEPLATNTREQLCEHLERAYRTSLDPETHSASGLLLEKLGVELSAIDEQLSVSAKQIPSTNLGWYVNSIGQTMIVLDPRKLLIAGSMPRDEINYAFAIANTELRLDHFRKCFASKELDKYTQVEDKRVPAAELSILRMTQFCNWLTSLEFGESECCYSSEPSNPAYYKLVEGFLQKKGYRIAFDSEWLFACQAGTVTKQFFGDSALLKFYGWHRLNGNQHDPRLMHPVGSLLPNPFGLFDIYGNASEICFLRGSENTFVSLGGNSFGEVEELTSSSTNKTVSISSVHPYQGMRLVRTLPDAPN
jgi:SpoVK/Ycf46/Vps4 family AAA+-type ATPase